MGFTVDDFTALGAGGICVLTVVGLFIYLIRRIQPTLSDIKTQNSINTEVIRNNTDAVKEVAKSNENVATALKMLQNTFDILNTNTERHNDESALIQNEIIKIGERTKACLQHK